MQKRPDWFYNEFHQIGLDFEDTDQVSDYDTRQGSDPESEQKLIEELGLQPGQTVIDLGCGTGSFTLAAARYGARVHAVDVSKTMLNYVERQCNDQGIQSVSLHHSGFLTYEHKGPKADWIVSRYALHHIPDVWKQVVLMRLPGMLADSGRFFLRDVIFSFSPSKYSVHMSDWIAHMARTSDYSNADFETHLREEYSTYSWIIEGMLARSGFVIESAEFPSSMYATYLCHNA